MNDFSLATITTVIVLVACIGFTIATAYEIPVAPLDGLTTPPKKTMAAFASEAQLRAYLKEMGRRQRRGAGYGLGAANMDAQAPVALPSATLAKAETKRAPNREESVTNVQHAGVDEGDIVKVHGNHLVILRRGRLFTVAINDGSLRPISVSNAFGPDINPRDTWYDEMLVSDETIVVIGYSYERGGTEVGLFRIDGRGTLDYKFTYHLRSNDYYSSRNYASRLIGDKLIFYSPSDLSLDGGDPLREFPAVRRWHRGAKESEFKRIVRPSRVYRPEYQITSPYGLSLHSVTVCDLSNGGFACDATGVIGPAGHVFYVSPNSVYVWMSDWFSERDTRMQSMIYRMPLDGSAPSALRVSGSPVDQFSFLESDDEQLNVLVRADSAGDGMWAAEQAAGDVALLRTRLSSFSDGSQSASTEDYQKLPTPKGYTFQNRFIGDYVLYGCGSGWGTPVSAKEVDLYAVNWKTGKTHALKVAHGVDRLEALGADAVVVGTDGTNLHFTSVRLDASPQIAGNYVRKNASQGELRSHGFFYKPDDDDSGTIGLPISVPGRPGYHHLFKDSAAIVFLRNSSLKFERLGELTADAARAVDDRCQASCVDWYGNARPLFLRGRVFALLGYEIVEGSLADGRIRERRRVNFAPGSFEVTKN